MSELDRVLAANRAYVGRRPSIPAAAPPARHLAVVTCMDARLDVLAGLGLALGEAHVLRNAGGRVTADTVRSLLLSTHVLGVREIGVIHHTRCGLEGVSNDDLRARIAACGGDAGAIDFQPFADVRASVVEDVETLRQQRGWPAALAVWGSLWDVATGGLEVVVAP